MKHINIPIFIPHLGCPNQCIFCNQRYISGNECFIEENVEKEILTALNTIAPNNLCEIAFFGGSFTGIDRNLMIRLLDLAQKYVNLGLVFGIRMSTRPDYISKEVLDILSNYKISCIELGIQSMNDNVLSYLKRGHTSFDTINAIKLLNDYKVPFVGQMMVGLPTASLEDELYCAEKICSLGATGARIYPTIVFKNTELEEITRNKQYKPLSVEEAIYRSTKVLRLFYDNNVTCIRIGLCDSENLHSDETFVAGPNDPSIGERVKSRLFYNLIFEELQDVVSEKIIIECSKGRTSQIIGNKRENIKKLCNYFNLKSIKVKETDDLQDFQFRIIKKEKRTDAIKIIRITGI